MPARPATVSASGKRSMMTKNASLMRCVFSVRQRIVKKAPEPQLRCFLIGQDQKFLMISTISTPMRFCASLVAAPIWGVQDTMGWLYRALLVAGSSA